MFRLNFQVLMLIFVGLSFTMASCSDDDENTSDQTIAENLADDDRFSTLVTALERTGLTSTFESGTYTLFAPTNAAFTAAGIDVNTIDETALTNVLLYHVYGGSLASTQIEVGSLYAPSANTTAPGSNAVSLYILNDGTKITVSGDNQVIDADIESSNGYIHAVNGVLMPPTVVDLAAANPSFTSLVGALQAANGDLVTTLSGTGPFTVFAPENSAFTAIQDVVDGLDEDQLAQVLTYHVLSGNVRSTDVPDGTVATVNGQNITLDTSNGVTIEDSTDDAKTVTFTDIQGTNGVIHVIDGVLIPAL